MPLRVSGKNISVGTVLRQRIIARVEDATTKYFRGGYSGASLEAEGIAAGAYESADQAAIHIEKRLRRYKRRRKGHQAQRGR